MPRFAGVVLDVDSTLTAIEGIDWLARRRGPDVAAAVARATAAAMDGAAPLDEVYGARLDAVRPSRDEVEALGDAYRAALAPGARDAIAALQDAGVRVVVVSGGLAPAVAPLARFAGVAEEDIHAVEVYFDAQGRYAGYDTRSPLTRPGGKARVVAGLRLPPPVLAVGDGGTDAECAPVVAEFWAFTAYARRDAAVAAATREVGSFGEVAAAVLGGGDAALRSLR